MTEKYYGRVGRTIVYAGPPEDSKAFMLQEAMDEMVADDRVWALLEPWLTRPDLPSLRLGGLFC